MTAPGVTQTILAGQIPGRQGNCLQAAIATLLELPLDEVPHFAESAGDWVEDMVEFGRRHGYRLLWRASAERPEMGLAFGPTVRSADILHAVAVRGPDTWDPHPSHAGLTSVRNYVAWLPVGDQQ